MCQRCGVSREQHGRSAQSTRHSSLGVIFQLAYLSPVFGFGCSAAVGIATKVIRLTRALKDSSQALIAADAHRLERVAGVAGVAPVEVA